MIWDIQEILSSVFANLNFTIKSFSSMYINIHVRTWFEFFCFDVNCNDSVFLFFFFLIKLLFIKS